MATFLRDKTAALSVASTETHAGAERLELGRRIHDPRFSELPWYRWWVLQQLGSQPQRLLLCLSDFEKPDDDADFAAFFLVWDQIRELALSQGPKNISGITESLVRLGIVSVNNTYEARQAAKDLVFAVLGWQTMLYKPEFTSHLAGQYAIVDELHGHRGDSRLALNQPAGSGNKSFSDLLLGFGMMLPPRNYCAFEGAEDQARFSHTRAVSSGDVNAHVLTKLCGVSIHWVDSVSCHLELDTHSGRLFLYRYPSFCVSCLQQHEVYVDGHRQSKSVLHRCALEKPGPPWATEEDVTLLLQEILLSYRLIFGQNKKSRSAFRRLQAFAGIPPQAHDKLLEKLCGRKRFDGFEIATLIERDEYDLAADFPHLRSKLVRLHSYASSKKPRSILQLWRDRRDSTAWLALWSVLVFGSISILLALLQAVFQILQYVEARQGSGG